MNKIMNCPFCGNDNVEVIFNIDEMSDEFLTFMSYCECKDCEARGPITRQSVIIHKLVDMYPIQLLKQIARLNWNSRMNKNAKLSATK